MKKSMKHAEWSEENSLRQKKKRKEDRPLTEKEIGKLSGKRVVFRGQSYPSHFVFEFLYGVPHDGFIVGYARPIIDNGTPGQVLVWEDGGVVGMDRENWKIKYQPR